MNFGEPQNGRFGPKTVRARRFLPVACRRRFTHRFGARSGTSRPSRKYINSMVSLHFHASEKKTKKGSPGTPFGSQNHLKSTPERPRTAPDPIPVIAVAAPISAETPKCAREPKSQKSVIFGSKNGAQNKNNHKLFSSLFRTFWTLVAFCVFSSNFDDLGPPKATQYKNTHPKRTERAPQNEPKISHDRPNHPCLA